MNTLVWVSSHASSVNCSSMACLQILNCSRKCVFRESLHSSKQAGQIECLNIVILNHYCITYSTFMDQHCMYMYKRYMYVQVCKVINPCLENLPLDRSSSYRFHLCMSELPADNYLEHLDRKKYSNILQYRVGQTGRLSHQPHKCGYTYLPHKLIPRCSLKVYNTASPFWFFASNYNFSRKTFLVDSTSLWKLKKDELQPCNICFIEDFTGI